MMETIENFHSINSLQSIVFTYALRKLYIKKTFSKV